MMDHVLSPRNGGVLEHPDLTGHAGMPGRGAFLILFLSVEEGRVAVAKYHTVGCGPTIACGSMLEFGGHLRNSRVESSAGTIRNWFGL
jgi:NifU-like protein involved in Fe-S cluster formation